MSDHDDTIHKGLAGVVADNTAISQVDNESNSLLYRGYPVEELAQHCSFEEVAFLLWNGEMPSESEKEDFSRREKNARVLPAKVHAMIRDFPSHTHPMDTLRTAVSYLGARDPENETRTREGYLDKALRLTAQVPTIVAALHRLRRGLAPIDPRSDLDFSENFLFMTFGDVPDTCVVEAFRVSMILYAEHSFNASTFTARVITSTESDYYSAITGAIGALKGPLHGGANEAVMGVFDEITSDEFAASGPRGWLESALASKRKIMGFGHRVYKNGDSRVPMMKLSLQALIQHYGRDDIMDMYEQLQDAMEERKGIKPNLDYPSGPAYHLMGFDTDIFTPLFVASRMSGWSAHVMEQAAANSLIRPLSHYNGVGRRHLS